MTYLRRSVQLRQYAISAAHLPALMATLLSADASQLNQLDLFSYHMFAGLTLNNFVTGPQWTRIVRSEPAIARKYYELAAEQIVRQADMYDSLLKTVRSRLSGRSDSSSRC